MKNKSETSSVKTQFYHQHVRHCRLTLVSMAVVFAFGCAAPDADQQAQAPVIVEQELSMVEQKREQKQKREPIAEAVTLPALAHATDAYSTMPRGLRMHEPSLNFTGTAPNSEVYQHYNESSVKVVSESPVSTFSVDVDTGSYSNARRMLNQGILPPADAIRVEEFLNYFDYQYDVPSSIEQPFGVNTAITPAPWNQERHILRIGLKGYEPDASEAPGIEKGSNLVFLLDVSGSMNQPNKLPLLKRSLTMLSKQLNARDKVAIVVYAGASGVVLEPTAANNTFAIEQALNNLKAGGSTNGAAGIEQAYQLAQQSFIKGGVNRVILATDGDFNVGMTNHKALIDLIEKQREQGIALTTLGFGQGNYNDHLMEQLADAGNGNYAYIDNINEARKVLVDELQSTMQIIAKDVKIQVEFNPEAVAEYRLIGYDNRILAEEDFNNDKVDAGDIGAGHTVTALYEITLVESQEKFLDERRYKKSTPTILSLNNSELAQVKLRYKASNGDTSQLLTRVVKQDDIVDFDQQSPDFKFALAVASFAQLIKGSKYAPAIDFQWIVDTAQQTKGEDLFTYRSEFIQLIKSAHALGLAQIKDDHQMDEDSQMLSLRTTIEAQN